MGTKHLLAATGVAVLVGGVSQGLAQSSRSDAEPRAARELRTSRLPIGIEGGRVFLLEIELVELDESAEFAGELARQGAGTDSLGLGRDRETVFWQSIAESENPAVFEAYLERWPEGTFAGLAQVRLEELATSSPVDARPAPTAAGDSRAARRLLTLLRREGVPPQPDENGWTLLHYAAVADLPDIVRQLLDEDGRDDWWRRSFGLSIDEAASDVNARLEDDGNLLSDRLRRVLGRFGFRADAWTRDGETPLHVAAMMNARGAVSELLADGADVHATTTLHWTPLHYAAQVDAGDAAEVLLAHDADPEARASGGWTPLHIAVWADSYEVARALVARGAEMTATNGDEQTAMELSQSIRMTALLRRNQER